MNHNIQVTTVEAMAICRALDTNGFKSKKDKDIADRLSKRIREKITGDLKHKPEDILDEIKNGIHDIYAQNLYCKEDMCNAAMMGYDCEDCLATFILDYIEKMKNGKSANENRTD